VPESESLPESESQSQSVSGGSLRSISAASCASAVFDLTACIGLPTEEEPWT